MYSPERQVKSSKGSVQFKTTKGRLQIVFSYPIETNGEIKRKRFYISTGYDDTPVNRQRVGNTVRIIQRDIDYDEVDSVFRNISPQLLSAPSHPFPQFPPILQPRRSLI
jgi:integrase